MTQQPPRPPHMPQTRQTPPIPHAPQAPPPGPASPHGQVPPNGLPAYGGGFSPQPPAPPKRRSGLILAAVAVAVALLAGAGYLAWSQLGAKADSAASGGLSTPASVKSASGALRYDKEATARMYPASKRDAADYPELKGLTQTDSVYVPTGGSAGPLAVHTGAGSVSDPAQRVKDAFAPNTMSKEPKDFALKDPGAPGSLLRCGVVTAGGDHIGLCVWADSTSVGDVIPVGEPAASPAKVDLDALARRARDLRKAMRGGSAD
ncbi:hypothetical protein [Streptomyces sp. NPDC093589]|uniref:hypothetical protein n=1 Tax=Streptomyces sp. NPDC093589 TaxID=3366043 RepID=UPI003813553C